MASRTSMEMNDMEYCHTPSAGRWVSGRGCPMGRAAGARSRHSKVALQKNEF